MRIKRRRSRLVRDNSGRGEATASWPGICWSKPAISTRRASASARSSARTSLNACGRDARSTCARTLRAFGNLALSYITYGTDVSIDPGRAIHVFSGSPHPRRPLRNPHRRSAPGRLGRHWIGDFANAGDADALERRLRASRPQNRARGAGTPPFRSSWRHGIRPIEFAPELPLASGLGARLPPAYQLCRRRARS